MRASLATRRYLSVAFLVVCCNLLLVWPFDKGPDSDSQSATLSSHAPIWPLPSAAGVSGANQRPVYRYSIIAGGADSSEELQQAVNSDAVVAEHYSDFNLARVRRVTLDAPQLMYVSYRVGKAVYWTKHKMVLAKGEAMLTDGRSMARGRCGNRVSASPVKPNALVEPTVEDFDAPVFPPSLSTPYLAASSIQPAGFPPGSSTESSGPPNSRSVPVAPFFPLPGGGGVSGGHSNPPPPGGGGGTPPPGGGGGTPPPGGGGTPPPVGIPEPGTGILVLIGLGGAWLVRRNKKTANL